MKTETPEEDYADMVPSMHILPEMDFINVKKR